MTLTGSESAGFPDSGGLSGSRVTVAKYQAIDVTTIAANMTNPSRFLIPALAAPFPVVEPHHTAACFPMLGLVVSKRMLT